MVEKLDSKNIAARSIDTYRLIAVSRTWIYKLRNKIASTSRAVTRVSSVRYTLKYNINFRSRRSRDFIQGTYVTATNSGNVTNRRTFEICIYLLAPCYFRSIKSGTKWCIITIQDLEPIIPELRFVSRRIIKAGNRLKTDNWNTEGGKGDEKNY